MPLKLGMTAIDMATGFEGVITAEVRYLGRRGRRYCLEGKPQAGKSPPEIWADGERLVEAVDRATVGGTKNGDPDWSQARQDQDEE